MREYALKLDKYGICYDRYQELRHFCLQYERLSERSKLKIDEAAIFAAGSYANELKKNICYKDMPYRYLNLPYSESQFKRMRRALFIYLNNSKDE